MIARLMTLPLADYVYGVDVESPAAALVKILSEKNMTVCTAESCTGGLVSKKLTDVAGCSSVVAGGVVTYQTREKEALLGVDPALIEAHTAVSAPVAEAMAKGALRLLDTDLAIATTGYAGPGGGTEAEPVGTVYIAVATKEGVTSTRLSLSSRRDRAYIREVAALRAVSAALAILQGKWQNS
jgi:nicotinamide-nucleotide amidase